MWGQVFSKTNLQRTGLNNPEQSIVGFLIQERIPFNRFQILSKGKWKGWLLKMVEIQTSCEISQYTGNNFLFLRYIRNPEPDTD